MPGNTLLDTGSQTPPSGGGKLRLQLDEDHGGGEGADPIYALLICQLPWLKQGSQAMWHGWGAVLKVADRCRTLKILRRTGGHVHFAKASGVGFLLQTGSTDVVL